MISTPSGLQYEDTVVGTGDTAVASKIAALKDKSIAKIVKDIGKYE